ncbi:MAG: hypothetical protein M1832_000133 [Thelocarpon impressellum]|nr:MAG: hypothetical protein M1832_000133 [Thelocarpon impressellum]
MKRLASLKSPSSTAATNTINLTKRTPAPSVAKSKAFPSNNPYPESGNILSLARASATDTRQGSLSTGPSRQTVSESSISQGILSVHSFSDEPRPPTIATDPGTTHSGTAPSGKADSSGAGTNITVGGAMSSHGGGGSTFSSPAPSERSLTTTLTTIQSTAPSAMIHGGPHTPHALSNAPAVPQATTLSHQHHHHQDTQGQQGIQFTHQFPSSPPASALPSHLAPQAGGNPTTYNTATANNLLSDNASILTLASSSKRRRRRSMDTDASVRALAPSSVFGGSRESLPLSLLSGNVGDATSTSASGAHQGRPSVSGIATAERASVYSSSGIAPALSSERNSYYAGKQGPTMDGGSIKGGLPGHGRNDSITGSIGASSPLASPREPSVMPGRLSRRSSGWGDVDEEETDGLKQDVGKDVAGSKGKGSER